jgi:hypothetical protein
MQGLGTPSDTPAVSNGAPSNDPISVMLGDAA